MRIAVIVAGFAALIASEPANSKTRFEAYDARDSIVEGKSGSRIEKDGIDFWTMGDPPRRYQIIGIIRDNRGKGVFHGNAIGSSGIAKKVREVGGDAAILLNQNSALKGIYSQGQTTANGNQAFGTGFAIPIQERTTTFLVVKYLEPSPAAP
jgi:hypothetical protein